MLKKISKNLNHLNDLLPQDQGFSSQIFSNEVGVQEIKHLENPRPVIVNFPLSSSRLCRWIYQFSQFDEKTSLDCQFIPKCPNLRHSGERERECVCVEMQGDAQISNISLSKLSGIHGLWFCRELKRFNQNQRYAFNCMIKAVIKWSTWIMLEHVMLEHVSPNQVERTQSLWHHHSPWNAVI